jgi:hypothetical protein
MPTLPLPESLAVEDGHLCNGRPATGIEHATVDELRGLRGKDRSALKEYRRGGGMQPPQLTSLRQ